MASAAKRGDARFEFTPPGGSSLTSPFLLAVPLSPLPDFLVHEARQRFAWRSADRSTREVVVISSSKADLVAAIRFDDQPARLRQLLRHALDDGMALSYKLSAGGTAYPMVVEEVLGGELLTKLDRDRGMHDEWEATIHVVMARTDLDALLAV